VVTNADQKDPRLKGLFERLRASGDPVEAKAAEFAIWQIWTEAGDPAIDSLMTLGIQAMQSGNIAGAYGLFDAVIKQAPGFAEGWNKRATVLYMAGQYDASAADVEKTLALEPRHFGALSGLGLINMARERDDDAVKAFEAALEVHPHLTGPRANIEAIRRKTQQRKRDI
jgi:tetratricopeptide (TPR) repeat protein